MKNIIIYIVSIFLMIFFDRNPSFAQNGKNSKEPYSANGRSQKMLIDRLQGEWELTKTIRCTKNDTIIQQPSPGPAGMTTAKPLTLIKFNSLNSFNISQFCMKCPMIEWKGQYNTELRNYKGAGFFYLTFVEQRDKFLKKKGRSLTAAFNGYLTRFEISVLELTDNKGTKWVYERKKEQ